MPSMQELSQSQLPVFKLSWGDIHHAVRRLATSCAEDEYEPKHILALARGGLIPATLLSHQLGGTPITSLTVTSYKPDRTHTKVRFEWPLVPSSVGCNQFTFAAAFLGPLDNPSTLIVDDLWDTGETMMALKRSLPEAKTAVLFHKRPEARKELTYFGLTLQPDQWVQFPWETEQQV
jgi:hypoxanthine phosphoribosyltransferase